MILNPRILLVNTKRQGHPESSADEHSGRPKLVDRPPALGYSIPINVQKLRIRESDTIRKKVYRYVREQILSGQVRPHDRLIEAKIASDIGTSRTPVREALHSLEIEGLIESIPRVGYVVKPISEEEVDEICAIRSVVEVMAARWAMERGHQKLVAQLAGNIEQAQHLISSGKVKAFVELDARFHDIISECSGSSRLRELTQVLRRHMLRYRIESINLKETALLAVEGHRRILKAMEKKDFEAMEKAVKEHLEQSRKDILRFAFREER